MRLPLFNTVQISYETKTPTNNTTTNAPNETQRRHPKTTLTQPKVHQTIKMQHNPKTFVPHDNSVFRPWNRHPGLSSPKNRLICVKNPSIRIHSIVTSRTTPMPITFSRKTLVSSHRNPNTFLRTTSTHSCTFTPMAIPFPIIPQTNRTTRRPIITITTTFDPLRNAIVNRISIRLDLSHLPKHHKTYSTRSSISVHRQLN